MNNARMRLERRRDGGKERIAYVGSILFVLGGGGERGGGGVCFHCDCPSSPPPPKAKKNQSSGYLSRNQLNKCRNTPPKAVCIAHAFLPPRPRAFSLLAVSPCCCCCCMEALTLWSALPPPATLPPSTFPPRAPALAALSSPAVAPVPSLPKTLPPHLYQRRPGSFSPRHPPPDEFLVSSFLAYRRC